MGWKGWMGYGPRGWWCPRHPWPPAWARWHPYWSYWWGTGRLDPNEEYSMLEEEKEYLERELEEVKKRLDELKKELEKK